MSITRWHGKNCPATITRENCWWAVCSNCQTARPKFLFRRSTACSICSTKQSAHSGLWTGLWTTGAIGSCSSCSKSLTNPLVCSGSYRSAPLRWFLPTMSLRTFYWWLSYKSFHYRHQAPSRILNAARVTSWRCERRTFVSTVQEIIAIMQEVLKAFGRATACSTVKACFNYLSLGHSICPSTNQCRHCQEEHHMLLHIDASGSASPQAGLGKPVSTISGSLGVTKNSKKVATSTRLTSYMLFGLPSWLDSSFFDVWPSESLINLDGEKPRIYLHGQSRR